jgi:hypothetical protein
MRQRPRMHVGSSSVDMQRVWCTRLEWAETLGTNRSRYRQEKDLPG